jgi:hypothetical protein
MDKRNANLEQGSGVAPDARRNRDVFETESSQEQDGTATPLRRNGAENEAEWRRMCAEGEMESRRVWHLPCKRLYGTRGCVWFFALHAKPLGGSASSGKLPKYPARNS